MTIAQFHCTRGEYWCLWAFFDLWEGEKKVFKAEGDVGVFFDFFDGFEGVGGDVGEE